MHLIFVLNLAGGEREILSVAISANERPWFGVAHFLDICICQ